MMFFGVILPTIKEPYLIHYTDPIMECTVHLPIAHTIVLTVLFIDPGDLVCRLVLDLGLDHITVDTTILSTMVVDLDMGMDTAVHITDIMPTPGVHHLTMEAATIRW
jgi:hypothetical protein